MTARVRVLVWYRAADHEQISAAYQQVDAGMAGTAGLLHSELLRSVDDPDSYAVLSEWQSLDALRSFQRGPGHRSTPEPLRLFSDRARPGGGFGVYQVS
jgi:heme oxygenase (mycobilin-producing)